MEQQRAIIAALNARFAAEEAAGTAPAGRRPAASACSTAASWRSAPTATLDYEDDLLARFDLVVASVHVARRQPRAELTRRTLNAIRSPHVDVIAHPSGRMIQTRDDLDLDWDAVFEAAARPARPSRSTARRTASTSPPSGPAGRSRWAACSSIDSDAHRTEELDYVRWGVDQARRAWVEPANVLNTRPATSCSPGSRAKPDAALTTAARTIRGR